MLKKILSVVKNQYFILALILIGGLGVRLYKLDNPVGDWHSWRQADTVSVSNIYFNDGIDILTPRYYDVSSIQTGSYNPIGLRLVEFPLFNVLNATAAKNFPLKYPDFLLSKSWKAIDYSPSSVELWARIISIVSSLGTALFLFLIGRRIYNKQIGLLAAFFFVFIPFNIYFSRVILPEPMAVMFCIQALYFFILFVENENKWFLYLSGILFASALLVKPFAFFYLIPASYVYIRKFGFRETLKTPYLLIRLLVFANIALAPFFIWRIWINNSPIGIPHFTWAFNGDNIRFKPTFWRWIFAERIGNLILGVWGIVLLAFSIIEKNISKKYPHFSHFMLLSVFVYVSTFATASVRHDYYQTFIIPAIALAVSVGTYSLWNNTLFDKTMSRGLVIFSILVMFMAGWVQVKEFYKVNYPEIVIAGMAVDKKLPKNAMVIAPYLGDTAFLYQTKRFGWPVVDTSFDKLIERGADYFVSVNLSDPDIELLSKTYQIMERTNQYIIIDLHKRI